MRAYEEWKIRGRTLAGCVEDEKMMRAVLRTSLSALARAPVGAQRPAPMIRSCGLMEIEHLIRYAPCAVGLMEIEHLFRSIALAVGLMEIENLIRYTEPAVGLKPSARQGKARLRGLYRIIYSKTISLRLWNAKPACAGYGGLCTQRPSDASLLVSPVLRR